MKKIVIALMLVVVGVLVGSQILIQGKKIVFIGDSIMYSGQKYIEPEFKNSYFDAKISRQFSTLPGILDKLKEQNKLGDVLVVGLGTNGKFREKDFEYAVKIMKGKDIFFINTVHKDAWEKEVNKKLEEMASQYENVYLIDWYSYAKKRTEYFTKDRTHLTERGRKFYAEFIVKSIKEHYKNKIQEKNEDNSQENNQEGEHKNNEENTEKTN